MRPYRFKIRLSSKRLNVTRLGKGPAAELRTAAPYSLGSASSDVELMERLLLSSQRHDRADCLPAQEAADNRAEINARRIVRAPRPGKKCSVTGSLAEIIIRPNFRPATALLDCDKQSLRWPGPFGPGFLSPQPPGAVGIGPVRRIVYPHPGPTKVGPFSFRGCCHSGARANPTSPANTFRIPGPRQAAHP